SQKGGHDEGDDGAAERHQRANLHLDQYGTNAERLRRDEQRKRESDGGGKRHYDDLAPADPRGKMEASGEAGRNGEQDAGWAADERGDQHGPTARTPSLLRNARVYETKKEDHDVHGVLPRALELVEWIMRARWRLGEEA